MCGETTPKPIAGSGEGGYHRVVDAGLELEYVGRIAGAAVLGGVIGLEREVHGQAAGLRTHMVVALGAAVMTIVGIRMAGPNHDPGRVAAQIVTGIGFLGAGAIMKLGTSVRGLTTAACIWTAAGIGMAIGSGWYIGAVASTIVTFITIFVFNIVERSMIAGKHLRTFTVKTKDGGGQLGRIEGILAARDVFIKEVGIQKDVATHRATIVVLAACPDKADVEALIKELSAVSEVESVEIG
jgi:putative Mg2+ transporter-C (MgtC) family protein